VISQPWTDPVLRPVTRLRSGRLPTGPHEAAVTPRLARALPRGATITLGTDPEPVRVVGVAAVPADQNDDVVLAGPGAVHADGAATQVYGVLPAGASATAVQAAHSVLQTRAEVAAAASRSATASSRQVGTGVLVGRLAVLEVALLAGAALAVGARRQRRQHRLLLAAGGEPRHVAATILGGGLIVGALATAAGVIGGMALARSVFGLIERRAPGGGWQRPRRWSWRGLGSALGILAGLVPAVGVVTASGNISLHLPWSTLGLAAVGVPVGRPRSPRW